MDNQATRQFFKSNKERTWFYTVHYGVRHLQCWHFLCAFVILWDTSDVFVPICWAYQTGMQIVKRCHRVWKPVQFTGKCFFGIAINVWVWGRIKDRWKLSETDRVLLDTHCGRSYDATLDEVTRPVTQRPPKAVWRTAYMKYHSCQETEKEWT
jgi:hypothetical protein